MKRTSLQGVKSLIYHSMFQAEHNCSGVLMATSEEVKQTVCAFVHVPILYFPPNMQHISPQSHLNDPFVSVFSVWEPTQAKSEMNSVVRYHSRGRSIRARSAGQLEPSHDVFTVRLAVALMQTTDP